MNYNPPNFVPDSIAYRIRVEELKTHINAILHNILGEVPEYELYGYDYTPDLTIEFDSDYIENMGEEKRNLLCEELCDPYDGMDFIYRIVSRLFNCDLHEYIYGIQLFDSIVEVTIPIPIEKIDPKTIYSSLISGNFERSNVE